MANISPIRVSSLPISSSSSNSSASTTNEIEFINADPLSSTPSSATSLSAHLTVPDKDIESSSITTGSSCSTRITFAPLPHVEPRKRKSSVKLGVASRSSIMRSRRAQVDAQRAAATDTAPPLPLPTHTVRARSGDLWQDQARASRLARMVQEEQDEEEEDLEDPFTAMGRVFKTAWRRVSQPQSAPANGRSHEGGVPESEGRAPPRPRRASSEDGGREKVPLGEDIGDVVACGGGGRGLKAKSILKVRAHGPSLHRMASEPANFGFERELPRVASVQAQ